MSERTERAQHHVKLFYTLPKRERDEWNAQDEETKASWRNALLGDEQIDEVGQQGNFVVTIDEEQRERFEAARNVEYAIPAEEARTQDVGEVEVVAEADEYGLFRESDGESIETNDFAFPDPLSMIFHNASGTEKNKDAGKGYLVFLLDTGVSKVMERMTPGGVVYRKSYVGGDAEDRNGHGSMSCSLAVPMGASLAVCKVLGDDGSGSSVGITAAIRDAAKFVKENPKYKGKVVLSGSLGGKPGVKFQPYIDACKEAEAAGVLCLWSAGNDGAYGLSPPSNWRDDRASIAFNRPTDRRADFSNHHESAALSAEGQSILMIDKAGRLVRGSGTSFSLPITTRHVIVGAWMRSTTALEMFRSMLANARDSAENVKEEAHGVVDLWGAINKLPKAPPADTPGSPAARYVVVAGTFGSRKNAERRLSEVKAGKPVKDAFIKREEK